MTDLAETVVVGRVTAVYGVHGWVKIHSYTEQPEAIFEYIHWLLEGDDDLQEVTVDQWRKHGDGLVARLAGVDDRDIARGYCQKNIRVDKALLPPLGIGDYYWHQLVGLEVFSGDCCLGKVTSLMETGANDVLVVCGSAASADRRERLIPYADQYVRKIDLDAGRIDVEWDPEF